MANANANAFQVPANGNQQDAIRALITGVREIVRLLPNDAVNNDQRRQIGAHLDAQFQIIQAAGNQANRAGENRPLTPIPPVPAHGAVAHIRDIRLNQLPEYGGKNGSQEACLSWLEKIMDAARAANLNPQAAKDLLKAKATDLVHTSIAQMNRDGLTLTQIVATLEVQFAGVIPAIEAKTKCSRMEKDPKESVSTFALKLRKMANIAARDEPTPALRTAMENELTGTNLRRALPPSVRKDLEDREAARRDDGKPDWTLNELIVQAELMDSRRQDRIAQINERRGNRPQQHKSRDAIRQVEEEPEISDDEDDQFYPDLESSNDDDECDEDVVALIKIVKEAEKKGYKGKQAGKYIKGAVGKTFKNRAPFQPYVPAGPPKLLREVRVNRQALPRLANVDKDQCLQCGIRTNPVHKVKEPGCPLRDKELTDRPCVKCGHGLHQADDCVVAFQGKFKADTPKNS